MSLTKTTEIDFSTWSPEQFNELFAQMAEYMPEKYAQIIQLVSSGPFSDFWRSLKSRTASLSTSVTS